MATPPSAPVDDDFSLGQFLKKYWFPLLLAIAAVVFIVQNTDSIPVNLLMLKVDAPAWLVYAILLVVGWVIGWFSHRRRMRRRVGL